MHALHSFQAHMASDASSPQRPWLKTRPAERLMQKHSKAELAQDIQTLLPLLLLLLVFDLFLCCCCSVIS